MNFFSRIIIFSLVLCFGVFALPFYIPAFTKTISPSNDYHFNNSVSVISLWFCLGLFLLLFYKYFKPAINNISISEWVKSSPVNLLPKKHLYFSVIFYVLIIFFLYLIDANYRYGEGDYFLERIDRLSLHQSPYRDFEYAYGVLFIYLPYFIKNIFGLSSSVPAYSITLILANGFGLYLLFRLLNAFNIEKKRKLIIFYSIVLCFIPYQNGLNYSILRYIAPIASIFLFIKYHDYLTPVNIRKTIYFSLVAIGLTAFNFLISIEMGFSIFLSIIVYLFFCICFKKKDYTLQFA